MEDVTMEDAPKELKEKESPHDKMMAIIVSVEGGEVLEMFEVTDIGTNCIKIAPAQPVNPTTTKEKNRFLPTEIINHFWAMSSPGCREGKVGGVWKKVCWP